MTSYTFSCTISQQSSGVECFSTCAAVYLRGTSLVPAVSDAMRSSAAAAATVVSLGGIVN